MEPFRFAEAREILTPHLSRARKREAARQAEARRETDRASGVAWSGLAAGELPPKRSERELLEEAKSALALSVAFAASARGRFLASLGALEELGYGGPAERARAAFSRGFSDPDAASCPAEIGTALAALARLDRPESRAACIALSELLAEALKSAAE